MSVVMRATLHDPAPNPITGNGRGKSRRLEIFLDPGAIDMMVISARVRMDYFKEPAQVNKW